MHIKDSKQVSNVIYNVLSWIIKNLGFISYNKHLLPIKKVFDIILLLNIRRVINPYHHMDLFNSQVK